MSNLCSVELPNITFIIAVKKGEVIQTPQYAKWMLGKKYWQIEMWVKEKKGNIKRC